eukprot:7685832-Alexandrium_andersonii.AAC.1
MPNLLWCSSGRVGGAPLAQNHRVATAGIARLDRARLLQDRLRPGRAPRSPCPRWPASQRRVRRPPRDPRSAQ